MSTKKFFIEDGTTYELRAAITFELMTIKWYIVIKELSVFKSAQKDILNKLYCNIEKKLMQQINKNFVNNKADYFVYFVELALVCTNDLLASSDEVVKFNKDSDFIEELEDAILRCFNSIAEKTFIKQEQTLASTLNKSHYHKLFSEKQLVNLLPPPIIKDRPPTPQDIAEPVRTWVDKKNHDAYICTKKMDDISIWEYHVIEDKEIDAET